MLELNIVDSLLYEQSIPRKLRLLERGILVADPEALSSLEKEDDPLLIQFILGLRDQGYSVVTVDFSIPNEVQGGTNSPNAMTIPIWIITDVTLATEIFQHSFMGFGPGIFKANLVILLLHTTYLRHKCQRGQSGDPSLRM